MFRLFSIKKKKLIQKIEITQNLPQKIISQYKLNEEIISLICFNKLKGEKKMKMNQKKKKYFFLFL